MSNPLGPNRLIDAKTIDGLLKIAAESGRKRVHLLLHANHEDGTQRLLIAAQPGSYIRPHIHKDQWEMLVVQRGACDVLLFDRLGKIEGRFQLDNLSPVIQIPSGQWHGCVIQQQDTLVLEVKPGPYQPNEFAAWAPEESTEAVPSYLDWAASAKIGQQFKGT